MMTHDEEVVYFSVCTVFRIFLIPETSSSSVFHHDSEAMTDEEKLSFSDRGNHRFLLHPAHCNHYLRCQGTC